MSSKEIKRLLENQIKQMETHKAGKMSGGKTPKWLKSVGHALGSVAKKSLPVIEKVGAKVGERLLNKAVDTGLQYALGGAKVDGRKQRGEIVKKIMKEKGLTLPQASKYVKEHKLY